MNRFQLKMIALITMIIDHMGFILFPYTYWIRLIGRLAFPIYAFFISEGLKHTSNRKNYLKKLMFFALVTQIPYTIVTYLSASNTIYVNTIFTLFFASLGISLCEKYKNFSFLMVGILLAYISKSDYEIFGILLIYIFYFIGNNIFLLMALVMLKEPTLQIVYSFIQTMDFSIFKHSINVYYLLSPIFILCSFILLNLYNGEKGRNTKYFFYIMYPLHFLILQLISYIFS